MSLFTLKFSYAIRRRGPHHVVCLRAPTILDPPLRTVLERESSSAFLKRNSLIQLIGQLIQSEIGKTWLKATYRQKVNMSIPWQSNSLNCLNNSFFVIFVTSQLYKIIENGDAEIMAFIFLLSQRCANPEPTGPCKWFHCQVSPKS